MKDTSSNLTNLLRKIQAAETQSTDGSNRVIHKYPPTYEEWSDIVVASTKVVVPADPDDTRIDILVPIELAIKEKIDIAESEIEVYERTRDLERLKIQRGIAEGLRRALRVVLEHRVQDRPEHNVEDGPEIEVLRRFAQKRDGEEALVRGLAT